MAVGDSGDWLSSSEAGTERDLAVLVSGRHWKPEARGACSDRWWLRHRTLVIAGGLSLEGRHRQRSLLDVEASLPIAGLALVGLKKSIIGGLAGQT